jgi:tetratricopeptide (TPR) repeat protein
MLPFISWGSVPLLTGVFALLVALAFLLRIRRSGSENVVSFRFTHIWIPWVIILALGAGHLVWSPVPYSSLLFLIHFSLAGVLYFLLIQDPAPDSLQNSLQDPPQDPPPDPTVYTRFYPQCHPDILVSVWTGSLIAWMAVLKFIPGTSSPGEPFSNPNYLATALLTCLAWFLGTLVSRKKSSGGEARHPILFLLAALLTTTALAVIGSRSAGLAILVLWGVFGIFRKDRFRFVAVAVMLVLLLAPTALRDRATEGGSNDPHAFSRLLIWEGAISMGMDHPVLGVGPGLYYGHAPRYAFPTEKLPVRYGRIARKPHNEYLRAWAEGGAVGVLAVMGFLFVTFRLFVSAWKRGKAGPVLAVAVFLFQALFHDLNEVFALTALGAFWLASLSGDETWRVVLRSLAWRRVLGVAGIITLLLALWLNMDVSSRVLWLKGQHALSVDAPRGMKILSTARSINPLLPGAARDLAWARLSMYRTWGSQEELESARSAIRDAGRLNRLATVPLRMEADLFVEQARRQPEISRDLHIDARGKLSRALDLEPKNALVMVALAGIEWEAGEVSRALQMVKSALELEPNYLEAHRNKITYLRKFDPEAVHGAKQELERAIERLKGYQPMSAYEQIVVK